MGSAVNPEEFFAYVQLDRNAQETARAAQSDA